MIELKDTIEMMTSPDHKERFRAEYFQLRIRTEKLGAMLEKYKSGTLPFTPTCSYDMLYSQYDAMLDLIDIMEERALVEGIDLSE